MPSPATDKRRFHRIEFDAPCELHCEDRVWTTEVLDICLKGVLVRRPEDWDVPLHKPCEVVVHLDERQTGIVMAVELRPGSHDVVFAYRNPGMQKLGALAGLTVMLGWAVSAVRRRLASVLRRQKKR